MSAPIPRDRARGRGPPRRGGGQGRRHRRRDLVRRRRRRGARTRRRVRLGQDHGRGRAARPRPPRREDRGRPGARSRGATFSGSPRRSCGRCAAGRSPTSRRTRAPRSTRRSGSACSSRRRSSRTASAPRSEERMTPAGRDARRGAAPARRGVPAPLSAPALRRPAAAGRARDGVRVQAARDRPRRADDRPRRDDPGARARHGPDAVRRARRGGGVREPRPRGRRHAGRPGRRHVRRPHRRARPRARTLPRVRASVHASPRRGDPGALRPARARGHPRDAAPAGAPAGRVLLRAALHVRGRAVRGRSSRPCPRSRSATLCAASSTPMSSRSEPASGGRRLCGRRAIRRRR